MEGCASRFDRVPFLERCRQPVRAHERQTLTPAAPCRTLPMRRPSARISSPLFNAEPSPLSMMKSRERIVPRRFMREITSCPMKQPFSKSMPWRLSM